MELSDGLRVILKGHLGWSKCRLDCFIGMLLALVRLKPVNLTQQPKKTRRHGLCCR